MFRTVDSSIILQANIQSPQTMLTRSPKGTIGVELGYASNCSYFPYLKITKLNLSNIYIFKFMAQFKVFLSDMVNFTNFIDLFYMLKIQSWYHSFIISTHIRIDFKYCRLNFNSSNQMNTIFVWVSIDFQTNQILIWI